jgi:SpoVK/Ycf46/Vps4 family AAA+-type ATPase
MSSILSVPPNCTLENLFLPDSVTDAIGGILEDQEYADALLAEGLVPRRSLLLHGPSGCGKTSIAHALANKLKVKLFIVSLAQMVGSHLGESEKNAETAFKFASQNRCVLLIDEFDSIAASRIDPESAAALASNRLVNTVLTCMDSKPPLGLLIACTNLFDAIDSAVVRRFDATLEVPPASRDALRKIAHSIVGGRMGLSVDEVLANASTASSVVKYANDLLRRRVIELEKHRRSDTLSLFGQGSAAKAIIEKLERRETEVTP